MEKNNQFAVHRAHAGCGGSCGAHRRGGVQHCGIHRYCCARRQRGWGPCPRPEKSIIANNLPFQAQIIVDKVLVEISQWWLRNGTGIVVNSIDLNMEGAQITLPPSTKGIHTSLELSRAIKDHSKHDESTHIIHCIKELFQAPPYGFDVQVWLEVSANSSLHGVDALTRSNRDAAGDLSKGRIALQ